MRVRPGLSRGRSGPESPCVFVGAIARGLHPVGLHFQVSLDTLSGRRKELRDGDREFRRADGTGEVPSA